MNDFAYLMDSYRGDPLALSDMSRLILGVRAPVAEFESDLIRERTRLGMEKAKAAGKRVGRPRAALPPRAEVDRLRAEGQSWKQISAALGCSMWAARMAA